MVGGNGVFFNMALVRDSDTSLWLHNKLGTINDLWSGGSICSQLNQDVLRNVKDCFIDLQSQVKLKLLLSFLHIPRRNVEEWKSELEEILELALVDGDQWVSMLAEILKSFPSTGTLNLEMEENAKIFTDLVTDLKKLVRKHSELGMLPMECLYLNKNALNAVIGHQVQPVKHFTLKRKPKSAALRAELLQKSADAASNVKRNVLTTGIPLRSRGLGKRMDDSTPLKGIPSRSPAAGFRSPAAGLNRMVPSSSISRPLSRTPAGRKDGGIKLLDINEQPIGYGREAKRRKKQSELEAMDQQKKATEATAVTSANDSAIPDYAAGLVSTGISSQLTTPNTPLATGSSSGPSYVPVSATNILSSTPTTISSTQQARENLQQTLQSQVRPHVITTLSSIPSLPATTIVLTPQTPGAGGQQATPNQESGVKVVTTTTTATTAPTTTVQTVQIQNPPQVTRPPQITRPALSLTNEQIQEAQDMFRNSNKVTRPEKALILGFMAGARENPCPQLGSVVTIKLNEDEESVQQTDGTSAKLIVESHFQMNYITGEWKKIIKYRKCAEDTSKTENAA